MNVKYSVGSRSFLALLLACAAWPVMGDPPAPGLDSGSEQTRPALPGKFVLTLKEGFFRLADDSQTINNHDWKFNSPHSIYAIEGEGWIGPEKDLSIGGEIIYYDSRFKRTDAPNINHKMQVRTLLVKPKYFFGSPNANWRPYIGAGFGHVDVTDNNGPIGGDAGGPAYQAVAGMQLRSERIGVRAEYMYLHAKVDDENDQKVNASIHGLFLGLVFYFGSNR